MASSRAVEMWTSVTSPSDHRRPPTRPSEVTLVDDTVPLVDVDLVLLVDADHQRFADANVRVQRLLAQRAALPTVRDQDRVLALTGACRAAVRGRTISTSIRVAGRHGSEWCGTRTTAGFNVTVSGVSRRCRDATSGALGVAAPSRLEAVDADVQLQQREADRRSPPEHCARRLRPTLAWPRSPLTRTIRAPTAATRSRSSTGRFGLLQIRLRGPSVPLALGAEVVAILDHCEPRDGIVERIAGRQPALPLIEAPGSCLSRGHEEP